MCTCGETEHHITARRMTADGRHVETWSNGAVTGSYGYPLPGCVVVRPRTAEAIERERVAASLVASEVCLYDLDEVQVLYAAARRVARSGGDLADLRAALDAAPPIALRWSTIADDAHGVCRVAVLDRMRWPGLAVWHERGIYEVMTRDGHDTLHGTGVRFRRLCDLAEHLRATSAMRPTVAA